MSHLLTITTVRPNKKEATSELSLNKIENPLIRLDFRIMFEYNRITRILLVGIKYSMSDLICDVIHCCASCFAIDQIPLGSSRHVSTRLDTFVVSSALRRACRAVMFDKLDTAKLHGLDTSNVSSRAETWRDEPSGIWTGVWTFRTIDYSYHGLFVSRVEHSYHGPFGTLM